MRTAAIMHDCVVRLLNHQDEESTECLCSLLTTMGKVLDLEEVKPQMDQYFNTIEKIVKEGKTSSRIWLMLQDIIDLRLHNWVSRGPEQGQNTIDEQEKPRKILSKETKRQPDPTEQRDQGIQNEEPWTTVPNRNKRRTRDPKNIPKVSTLINPGARQPPTSKIIMRQSVQQDLKLKTSENARKPDMKTESLPAKPISQETKDLFKKVHRILYRLTPQNFHQLMKQVMVLTIDTEERLKGVVDMVFEKAINESSLSMPYGEICCCLATLKVPISDKQETTVSFIKLLVSRCQKEFEKDKDDDMVIRTKQNKLDSAARMDRHRLLLELQKAKDIFQRRSTGNIKLIGELFVLEMLPPPVMHDCMKRLLQNHDKESLECLCSLLTTIGKVLDLEEAKPWMDQYFKQIEKIFREGNIATRIRVRLQDIIDLRLNNWVSRGPEQGPITIVHKEAKIKEKEEPRKVQPQMDEKIQQGPWAQVTLVKGSGGGAKAGDSALQSSPSPQPFTPPQEKADFDGRRGNKNRNRRNRLYNLLHNTPAHTDPLTGGTSQKELLESPAPEEHCWYW